VKVRDVLWLLRRDGWVIVRQTGSHRQLRHAIKAGTVTVAGAPHHDLHPKTASSILKQAGHPTRD
jgi:predicted RNA binding protein YcfA (HicA-like mRNA interferase family)